MQKSLYSIIPFHVRNKGKPKNIQNVLIWGEKGEGIHTHTKRMNHKTIKCVASKKEGK